MRMPPCRGSGRSLLLETGRVVVEAAAGPKRPESGHCDSRTTWRWEWWAQNSQGRLTIDDVEKSGFDNPPKHVIGDWITFLRIPDVADLQTNQPASFYGRVDQLSRSVCPVVSQSRNLTGISHSDPGRIRGT